MSEADGFSQPRPVFCLWSLVGSPDLPTPGSATFRGIPVKVIQGKPLTWKTWKSQGIPKWSEKSQGKWKKSGRVKSGVFFQALNTPKLIFGRGSAPDTAGKFTMFPRLPSQLGRGHPIPFPPAVTTPTVK